MSGGVHSGSGLVPVLNSSDTGASVVVGYNHSGAQWRGQSMTGMPSAFIPFEKGSYKPQPSYDPDDVSARIAETRNAPPADVRALPGLVTGQGLGESQTAEFPVVRLKVLPRVTVENAVGETRNTNLAVGVTRMPRPLSGGILGNTLIIMEKLGKASASPIGAWPLRPPFGNGVNYNIHHAGPQVDEITGLVALPVSNLINNKISWFVLDLRNPLLPRTVARVDNATQYGAISNGLLTLAMTNTRIATYRVTNGIDGLDGNSCLEGITITARFQKPKMVVNSANPIQARLDFSNTFDMVAPFVMVQIVDSTWNVVSVGGRALEAFTDSRGVVHFDSVPDGTYFARIVPKFQMVRDGQVVASGAVYNQAIPRVQNIPGYFVPGDPSIMSLAWPNAANQASAPPIVVSKGRTPATTVRVPVRNTLTDRFSGPFNILNITARAFEYVLDNKPRNIFSFPYFAVSWRPNGSQTNSGYRNSHSSVKELYVADTFQSNTDEFDDGVLGHEIGHIISASLNASSPIPGDHNDEDPYEAAFTLNEGWATFFQGIIKTLPTYPDPNPNYYNTVGNNEIAYAGVLLDQLPSTAYQAGKINFGLFQEDSNARVLWRCFQNQLIFNQDGNKLFLSVDNLNARVGPPTLLRWANYVDSTIIPGSKPILDQIIREEFYKNGSWMELAPGTGVAPDQPWLLNPANLGDPHLTHKLQFFNNTGNRKESVAYYSFFPADTLTHSITLEINLPPGMTFPAPGHYNRDVFMQVYFKGEYTLKFPVLAAVQPADPKKRRVVFEFTPTAVGLEHIIAFRATIENTSAISMGQILTYQFVDFH